MCNIQLIVAIFSSFFCFNTYAWKTLFEKSDKKLEELDLSLYEKKKVISELKIVCEKKLVI